MECQRGPDFLEADHMGKLTNHVSNRRGIR